MSTVRDDAEWRKARRRDIAARRLLEKCDKSNKEPSRGVLRDMASLLWPNRDREYHDGIVAHAVFLRKHGGQTTTSGRPVASSLRKKDDEKQTPSSDGSSTKEETRDAVRDYCLEKLREDPERDYSVVLREVRKRWSGWEGDEGRLYFIRSPWRSAKLRERKERTGSIQKKETREAQEIADRILESKEAPDPPDPNPTPEEDTSPSLDRSQKDTDRVLSEIKEHSEAVGRIIREEPTLDVKDAAEDLLALIEKDGLHEYRSWMSWLTQNPKTAIATLRLKRALGHDPPDEMEDLLFAVSGW